MKVRFLSMLACGLALAALCGCRTPPIKLPMPAVVRPTPAQPTAFWPLERGTSWAYAGTLVRPAKGGMETNAVRLTCEVLYAQASRGYLVAKLSNFPVGFSPWEGLPTNAVAVLICTPAGAFHLMELGQARPVLARLADPQDTLDDLLDFETQILAEPLHAGLRWGDPIAMQRFDGLGCWVVHAPHAEAIADVAGVFKTWKLETFPIMFRTNPDHLELQFVPHVGLRACDYVHHGTPGEVHLKLVEFRLPPPESGK